MKTTRRKYKFQGGIQRIENDTPDYSSAYKIRMEQNAKQQMGSNIGAAAANIAMPGLGSALQGVGAISDAAFKDAKGNYKNKFSEAASLYTNPLGTASKTLSALTGDKTAAADLFSGSLGVFGVKNPFGKTTQEQVKDEAIKAEKETKMANINKRYSEGTVTDAQAALAKKGKYKVKTKAMGSEKLMEESRLIESEGREPVFGPKMKNGKRKLLFYNPKLPTHKEGGVPMLVVPKEMYSNGTSNLMPRRSKVSLVGSGIMAEGNKKTKVIIPQQKMSHKDSVAHQANKILKYEQLRGGPGGAPLPSYSDPKYKQMLMDKIYPEVNKIIPNASAMEKGEAMDFIFNAGWDQTSNKITKDPRAFALQEYYKQNNPSKLDAEGKWAGRKGAPYSFDKEYANTVGKLSENERRIMMNKGRDWYYKNINNPAPGVPNSNYKNTWYGRIHNTNDFNEFNPNNPKFTPKKVVGAKQLKVNTLNDAAFSSNLTGMPAVNAANKFAQPLAGIQQVARNIPEDRRKEKINTPRSHKKVNPDLNKVVDPPMLYEMKPPPPRSTFNTKNDFKKGGKYIKTYQEGTSGTEAGATYKHVKTFKSKPAYQTALQAHDDSLNLYGQSRYFTDKVKESGLYQPTVENPPVKNITRTGSGKASSPLKAYGAPNDTSEDIMSVAGINPMRKDLYSRKESQYKSFKEWEEAKASGKPHGTYEGYEINMYKHPEMAVNYAPDTISPMQGRNAKLQTTTSTTTKTPVKQVTVPTRETTSDTTKTNSVVTNKPVTSRGKFVGKEKTLLDKAGEFLYKVGSSKRMSNGKSVRVFK